MFGINKLLQKQFNIRISISNEDLFGIENHKVIKEINSSKGFFKRHPIVFNADPFLFVNGDYLFVFYEEQIDLLGKGLIKMVKTKDLKNWTKPIIVLEENFHLSYPNVFQDGSNIYMIPETGHDNSIKLYKPNNDFTKWTLYKTLLSGHNYVDTSILFKEDKYYLFTSIFAGNKTNLLLYISDSIEGQWEKHPSSPIGDNLSSRCGGAIIESNNTFYRPSQIQEKNYGEGLKIHKITTLTPCNYLESMYTIIIPNANSFYTLGGHHFSTCQFKNKRIVATDGLSNHLNFWEVIRRVKNKLL